MSAAEQRQLRDAVNKYLACPVDAPPTPKTRADEIAEKATKMAAGGNPRMIMALFRMETQRSSPEAIGRRIVKMLQRGMMDEL